MATDRRPVLVVDDEADIREMLRDYLESRGHEVLEAANGLGAIRHIQKFDASIRVVVVSGYVDEATRARLDQLGVAVLPKPLDIALLDALVG